jgi:hypothetical protein
MTDANLAKPRSFETKNMPGSYSPAPVPEFHQQAREPGYSNSEGEAGDDGGQEWAESNAAAGKFGESSSDDSSTGEKKAAPTKTSTTKTAATTK